MYKFLCQSSRSKSLVSDDNSMFYGKVEFILEMCIWFHLTTTCPMLRIHFFPFTHVKPKYSLHVHVPSQKPVCYSVWLLSEQNSKKESKQDQIIIILIVHRRISEEQWTSLCGLLTNEMVNYQFHSAYCNLVRIFNELQ